MQFFKQESLLNKVNVGQIFKNMALLKVKKC